MAYATYDLVFRAAAIPVCAFAAVLLYVRKENLQADLRNRYLCAVGVGWLFLLSHANGHLLSKTESDIQLIMSYNISFGDSMFGSACLASAVGMIIAARRNSIDKSWLAHRWLTAGVVYCCLAWVATPA